MTDFEQHDLEWNERLQDLVDNEVSAHERAVIEAHTHACARCRSQFQQLQRVHAALSAEAPHLSLDSSFDRELFARITALDAVERERARRRMEREMSDNLRNLTHDWRRKLLFIGGSAVSGAALIAALLSWAKTTGFAAFMIDTSADALSLQHSGVLPMVLAAFAAAIVGAGIANWVASTVD